MLKKTFIYKKSVANPSISLYFQRFSITLRVELWLFYEARLHFNDGNRSTSI